MFQLSQVEVDDLSRSQFVTLKGKGSKIKFVLNAFTELGVAMLSSFVDILFILQKMKEKTCRHKL